MSKRYLLEIGTEEIPARLVADALEQLKNNSIKILNDNKMIYEKVEVYSTPRRLTLIIEGLNNNTEDLVETVKGPSKKISFDESGEPTRALLGFMKGQGVQLSDVSIQDFNGEEYVYAKVEQVTPAVTQNGGIRLEQFDGSNLTYATVVSISSTQVRLNCDTSYNLMVWGFN